MNHKTRKLSGAQKDRFFQRFLAAEPDIAAPVAARLAARCSATFSSVRVRRAMAPLRPVAGAVAAAAAPAPSSPAPGKAPAEAKPPAEPAPAAAAAFDPYVFGLVPVYQREGRDGLMAKLATVLHVDHLRQMAKAQQIALPQELRAGDVAIDDLRAAIAVAVAKRIADRAAAAG
jgi:hypothetical protein